MSEMHPTRWTFTAFIVLYSAMNFVPRTLEPTDFEPLAWLLLSLIALLFAIFDLLVAAFARNISRRQKVLRRINAAVLLGSVTAALVARVWVNPYEGKRELEPDLLDMPSSGEGIDESTEPPERSTVKPSRSTVWTSREDQYRNLGMG